VITDIRWRKRLNALAALLLAGTAWILIAGMRHCYYSPVRVEVVAEEADDARRGQVVDVLFVDMVMVNEGDCAVVIFDVTLRFGRHAGPRYHMMPGHVDGGRMAGPGLVLGPGEEMRRRFWFPWSGGDLANDLAIDPHGHSVVEGSILVTLGRYGHMERRLELPGVSASIEDGAFTGLSHRRTVARYIGT